MSMSGAEAGGLRVQGRHRYSFAAALAAGSAALSLLAPEGVGAQAAAAAAATILFLLMLVAAYDWRLARQQHNVMAALAVAQEHDPVARVLADIDGRILFANRVARSRFGTAASGTLVGCLGDVFDNPAGIIDRVSRDLDQTDGRNEDVQTRNGIVRVAAHTIRPGVIGWRVEPLPDSPQAGRAAEYLPIAMITVGRTGAILFMNDAARHLAGGRLKSLDELFVALPVRPGQINQIRGDTGRVNALVVEHKTSASRSEIFLLPAGEAATPALGGLEAIPVPVLKLSTEGQVLALNMQARELLGGEAGEGDAMFDHMTGLGRPLADWLRDVAVGKMVNHTEFLRLTRSDKETYVQVTLSRAREDGEKCVVAVLHDATELKSLEAQFVQTQKMQSIGQLAGGVAHDFNNLLAAISGHCDLLLLQHDQGDLDYADLIQIRQNANRAAALVSQLLAFSRKQTLRPEVLNLRDTLADLTHLLNRLVGDKVTLTLSHDPVLKTIRADKRQLEQVLMNLVVNARDAMPAGGDIRIETEAKTLPEPLRRDRARVPEGDYVLVRVIDQGVGIEPDKLQKVFEPFYTTKRTGEGTGLGLSTAYGIFKQTGGFIFVDSTPGIGTSFTLYLPVFAERPVQTAISQDPVAPVTRQGDGVVLLVEDEAPVRAFASRALRLRGYTVLEADNAEDALELLSDPAVAVDVFVTDVVMPGMDGPSWVRLALKDRPNVRVVFVSGYAEGAFGDDGPAVPNSTFLPKLFSLSQLTETVNQQMH
ncbi:MAG: response regulator [Marinibacterium sp.]|nr:response regulator [Marinibacterium sp.]